MMFVKTIIALSLAILAVAASQLDISMSIFYLKHCSCTILTKSTQLVKLSLITLIPMCHQNVGLSDGIDLIRTYY